MQINLLFMKKLLILLAGIFTALAAFAQTPDEIIARMEQAMDGHENDGMAMTMDMKIPILGTISTRNYMLGDKLRIEGKMMNRTIVSFIDGTTVWDIDDEKKEVTDHE
jgi:outer membrane lipoprotein-sorting protein